MARDGLPIPSFYPGTQSYQRPARTRHLTPYLTPYLIPLIALLILTGSCFTRTSGRIAMELLLLPLALVSLMIMRYTIARYRIDP